MAEKKQIKLADGDIDQVAAWVLAQVTPLSEKVKALIDGFSLGNVVAVVLFLAGAVEAAVAKLEGLSGSDKKKILVKVLNALVDIPLMPESVEEWALSMVIDQALDFLNKQFGKNWLKAYGKIGPEVKPVKLEYNG